MSSTSYRLLDNQVVVSKTRGEPQAESLGVSVLSLQYRVTLEIKTYHYLRDALSRLRPVDAPEDSINDSFSHDKSATKPFAQEEPRAPVFDGILLHHLTPVDVHGQHL